MKVIASILLLVFSCTISVPLVQSIFAAKSVTVFVVDEEKSSTSQLNEIKESKQSLSHTILPTIYTFENKAAFTQGNNLAAMIPPAPLLEKPTPPPNFC